MVGRGVGRTGFKGPDAGVDSEPGVSSGSMVAVDVGVVVGVDVAVRVGVGVGVQVGVAVEGAGMTTWA